MPVVGWDKGIRIMKTMVAILCAGLWMAVPVQAEDMTTLSGQTYSNIVVQGFDEKGFFIRYDGGSNMVPFSEITAELRGHYKALSLFPIPVNRLSGEKEERPAGANDLETLSGQIYRNVVLKKVNEDSILIAHETGMATVSFLTIPPAEQEKWRTGTAVVPDPAPGAEDLVTAYGQVFRKVEILREEPDGLTIRHAGGVTKIGFPALGEEMQKKYHYDPVAGWNYRREQAAQKAAAAQPAEPESQGPTLVQVNDVRAEALPDEMYRISFSLKNLTDQAQSVVITFKDGKKVALITRTVDLHARADGKLLQMEVPTVQPRSMGVVCGTYRTNCVLNW